MKKILFVVDPQNDFITGSLAVEGAENAMRNLAEYIKNTREEYEQIFITMDSHEEKHCSFQENGGQWPVHCVVKTKGWEIPEYILEVLPEHTGVLYKGYDKEEYSIFESDYMYTTLGFLHIASCTDEIQIDVCGIAGDYCVLNTIKDLVKYKFGSQLNILTKYIVSIDGGETLNNYINENNLKHD
jgi:nicotinamidase/pyrazinamidase